MSNPWDDRYADALKWAKRLRPGQRFTDTDADGELSQRFVLARLLPASLVGFEARPYLVRIEREGIIKQVGRDEWMRRDPAAGT